MAYIRKPYGAHHCETEPERLENAASGTGRRRADAAYLYAKAGISKH